MPLAQEMVDYVFEIAPNPTWAKENIFEFGDGKREVQAVGLAWWITSAMLEEFARLGVRLGLSHERVVYDLPEWYHWGQPVKTMDLKANQRIAGLCAEHGIAIHRFHSNLDVAPWGMPRALLDQLGWADYPSDWSRGVPVIVHPPVAFKDLIAEVKDRLGLPFVRFDGDPGRMVSRVALAWGGMCQYWAAAGCAAGLGFDVLLGGDIIDGVVRLAREEGWAVLDAMHHATEMEAVRRLAGKLEKRFPTVQVHYRQNSMPWAVA